MADHFKSNEKCIPSWLLQPNIEKIQVKKQILRTAHHQDLNKQTN